jgi:hypothetical protein
MSSATLNKDVNTDPRAIKKASNAALASILNLTFLPGLAFIWLMLANKKNENGTIESYHTRLGIKLNLLAGAVLILVSGLMIALGGFNSAWTWVYVITYFTFVHTTFIVVAIWTLTRAWSGLKLTNKS